MATVKKTIASKATKAEEKMVKETHSASSGQAKLTTAKKSVSLEVFGLDGKAAGKVSVSAEIFGDKVNKTLLAQAVRVYLANQRQGNASTKTRGEVDGSTRKIYKQKGTGRARHGSVRAPIFVKGGIVFGPKPRDYSLSLPTKMKRKALFSALSAKVLHSELIVVDGFATLEGKTKKFVDVLKNFELNSDKKSVLLVTANKTENVKRAARNVQGVDFLNANRLNAYEVLKSKKLLVMKEALDEMEKTFLAKSIRQAQDK